MASNETWNKLEFFRPDSAIDKWGDPNEIDDEHVLRLDDFRRYINCPVFVTAGVKSSGHSKSSWHYGRKDAQGRWMHKPCATDIIMPEYKKGPIDLILDATRFGFTGIGYYVHWKFADKVVGGLHVDSRPLTWDNDFTLNYSNSRWLGILVDGVQKYIPLTYDNIIKYTQGVYSGQS